MKKLIAVVIFCFCFSFNLLAADDNLPDAPQPKQPSLVQPVVHAKVAGDRFFSPGNTAAIIFSGSAAGYHAYETCYAYNEKEKLAQVVPYVHSCASQIELSSAIFGGGLILSAVFHNTGHKRLKVFANILAGTLEGGAAVYQKFYH